MKRKTLVLRVPKDVVRKRKRPITETQCDYLEKYQRPVNRRRVDPVVVLSNSFEAILNEMRDLPESDPFHFPVNSKVWHEYVMLTAVIVLITFYTAFVLLLHLFVYLNSAFYFIGCTTLL